MNTNEVSTTNALKDYAFCSCIRHEFGDSLIIDLNEGSLSSYMSSSDYNLDEFSTIDSVSKVYADSVNYQSKNNHNLGFKKCLDFYNSTYLKKYLDEFNSK